MTNRDEYFDANRTNWDERVPIHTGGDFYDVESFKRGDERLRPFELAETMRYEGNPPPVFFLWT